MLLPIRTAPEDVETVCGYLLTKPAGVSPFELIRHKKFDGRRLAALEFWGLIEDGTGKLTLTPRGRLFAADGGAQKTQALREVLLAIPPYASAIAGAAEEPIMLPSDIAAGWQRDFRSYLHFHAGVLNHQIVCFLRIAEAAALGRLVVGRKGKGRKPRLFCVPRAPSPGPRGPATAAKRRACRQASHFRSGAARGCSSPAASAERCWSRSRSSWCSGSSSRSCSGAMKSRRRRSSGP
jgi:hypothetical protein